MSYKVLIIDDDEGISRLLTRYFNDKGVWVTSARDGEEGFRLFHKLAPDAVVLDLMLPRQSGEQVLTLIRSHARLGKTPVVVMSASLTQGEQERELLKRLKADGAFRKPLLLKELLSKVDELVGHTPAQPAASAIPTPVQVPAAPVATQPPRPAAAAPVPRGSFTRGTPVTDPGPALPTRGKATLPTLSRLVVHAFETRMDGVLEVSSPHAVRRLGFSDGLVVNVSTSLMGESLGMQLVQERVITEDQARLVRAIMNKRSLRFAEAVLLLGVPSPQLLIAAERQARLLAARALCATESTYELKPWATSSTLGTSYQLDPLEAVQRACLQCLTGARLKEALDSLPEGSLLRSDAFNERLFLFTRLRPHSSVPVALMDWPRLSDARQRIQAGGDEAAQDLLALVLSQAVVLGEPDKVSLRARRAAVLATDAVSWDGPGISKVDAAHREGIAADWINTAGRNAYDVLGVSRDASLEDVRAAHAHQVERLGPPAKHGADLGPATPYLIILRTRRDEALRILGNPILRAAYDEALAQERAAAVANAARWNEYNFRADMDPPHA